MAASPCIFCEIANKTKPAHVVFEDESSIAFLDWKPVFVGHTLLVPKRHVVTLGDLDDDVLPTFFLASKHLARAVERGMNAEGTFCAINNRVSQSVPHLHFHVVPRTKGDGLRGFFWPRQKYAGEDQMRETAEQIRAAF